jgi:hypothetical protein
MVVYVWNRLHRINAVFQALAALILAGKLPPERVCRPRTTKVHSVLPALCDPAKSKLFSWRFAWLCVAVPSLPRRFGAAQFGGHLRHLLSDPEMMGLIAASPRIRRTLRPLLWMLGIEESLIRPSPPPPLVVVAQEPTDEIFVTAPLVCPSYPPGDEVSAVEPDDQARNPEFSARA